MPLLKAFSKKTTMKKIETISHLRAEIARVQIVAKEQEQLIKNDLKEIREGLKPENIFWNALSSFTGIKMSKAEFFKDGIAFGLSLILQRFVLKTEKKIENKVYDFIDSLFDRVKSMVNKFSGSEAKRSERKEAEENIVPGE